MDVDDYTFGNSRGTPPQVMCTILGFNKVLILVWLKVSITQIFNALVEVLQAAYHPLVSKHPNDNSNRQIENGNKEINKILACFSENHSTPFLTIKSFRLTSVFNLFLGSLELTLVVAMLGM